MATLTATTAAPRVNRVPQPGIWLPAYTLWRREIVRFYRQKARVVGVIASPLLFWLVLGSGFANSFHSSGSSSDKYLGYFFPGAVAMIVLFTAIFSMMSLIQDRNEGFLLSVLAAPVSRSSIVLGKVMGGATLAAIQGIVFLVFTPLVGVHPSLASIGISVAVILMISFELTALGFTIAWPMDSPQAFHAIVNLILLPLWMLSGSLFPASGASGWMRLVMLLNPLTYGVDALRNALFPAQATSFPLAINLAVTAGFCLLTFIASWAIVNRRSNRPAA
ncbi:ABC transporter permease [Acidipila rosea]|uniref:Transport permease protein n=1 Tax=Acidipila rosea TaxID=768535 RepID=A0A4R1LA90_9BACT|nr:ABC transporter permease [Acidipila rosea]MBW4027157.1 ABC transporter permease [Acidobacteriota bacterium]MBW4045734.1 ABC transporter permease [Acidobacteriota bacterium]TCK74337.1 ABC-2 type transport system permease protein [Acidipila rosea]